MADGFIVRRGGKAEVIEKAETPTINFVSSTTTSITFTIKNNDAQTAVILWEQDDTTPDANTLELAAGTTSSNLTISGLTEGDLLTIYATANVTDKIKSNVAELERGTTLATPTITQVSKNTSSITFTVRNESNTAASVTYGLTSPPTTTTLELAANTTSTNQTISGLDDDTSYTVFAEATKTNYTNSAIASSTVTTDPLTFALSFDGVDDYVDTETSDLQIQSNYTFETTVYYDADEGGITLLWARGRVSSGSGSDNRGFQFFVAGAGANAGKLGLTFFNVDDYGFSSVALTSKAFNHVALTIGSGTAKYYINGVERGSFSVGTYLTTFRPVVMMASYTSDNPTSITNTSFGKLREIRFWNVTRTGAQIDDNKNVNLTGSESGLITLYKVDEGTGTTLNDSAGSNDATIIGATWVTI
jgi:hypothetical protein